nr:transmembrane 9 superfamily member 9-like [Ipomoea batatas]
MREPEMCHIVCRVVLDDKTAKEFKSKIDDEYRVNMILDNLPLVVPVRRLDQESPPAYQQGYYIGVKGQYAGSKDEKFFIHNHLTFTVKYHRDLQTDSARIVGFEVMPFSVKHEYEGEWSANTRLTTCDPHAKRTVSNSNSPQEVENKQEIIFTYDVEFQESEVKWASRWDTYLLMADDQIHWFSVVNSLMIVLFLSGMVAMIMLRTAPNSLKLALHLCGNWCTVLRCDACNNDICCPWLPFSFKSWWSNDSHALALGFHGTVCRLFLCPSLQDV